jgi:alkylation response protein AidB-like acyl-CoA dehydrogenase
VTDTPTRPFALSGAQERLLDEVRGLAREVLAPLAAAGRPGRVNRELVRALGEHGLVARVLPAGPDPDPERPGDPGLGSGPGASAMELCLLREALARETTEAETALALQGLGGHPIAVAGTGAARARWLPEVVAGRAVAAFALSEAAAGSDAAGLELRADPDGDGFRLSGTKAWISNAPEADLYTVFARTTPGARSRGITAFAVPGDAPGLGGAPLELLAPHAIGRLELDGVRVGPDQVLGRVDQGFGVAMATLDRFRPSVGAFAVGMAQAALDVAVAHDADPAAPGVTRAAAMAKLFATETAQAVVDMAVQVLGARALERGHLLEHLYREVRAPRIYEGTSEIQRTVIARDLFRALP